MAYLEATSFNKETYTSFLKQNLFHLLLDPSAEKVLLRVIKGCKFSETLGNSSGKCHINYLSMTRLQQVNITYEKCVKYVEGKQVAS